MGVPEGKNTAVRANEPVPAAVGGWRHCDNRRVESERSGAPEVLRVAIGQDPSVRPNEPVALAVRRGGHSDYRGGQVHFCRAAEELGRTIAKHAAVFEYPRRREPDRPVGPLFPTVLSSHAPVPSPVGQASKPSRPLQRGSQQTELATRPAALARMSTCLSWGPGRLRDPATANGPT